MKMPCKETMIRSGEIQRRGNRALGQIPIPASPATVTKSVHHATPLGQGNVMGKKFRNFLSGHEKLRIHCRVPTTAGRTVEKGRVAYQKYSQASKLLPT